MEPLWRMIDEVTSGRLPVDSLDKAVQQMPPKDLEAALNYIAEKAASAELVADVTNLIRLMADLLIRYAKVTKEPYAGHLAGVAAELYRMDLNDPEAAEIARIIASVRGLNPAAMAQLFETYGERLDEDTRIRLLEVIVSIGDEVIVAKYSPVLTGLKEERIARLGKESVNAVEKARVAFEMEGNAAQAASLLDAHLNEEPTDRKALSLLTRVLKELDRMPEVEAAYQKAISMAPAKLRAELLCDLGEFRESAQDLEKSINAYEAAVESDHCNERALDGYIRTMKAAGRLEAACVFLERLRAQCVGQPNEVFVITAMAKALEDLRRPDDAEKMWRRLRAIDPRNRYALLFYEEYHEARQDWSKLYTTLQFAVSVTDDVQEKLRLTRKMARVAEDKLNNLERAIEAYRRILSIDPEDTESEQALISLYEKTRKWHALVEFYNERFRRLPPEQIDERVATLFRIIEIYQDPEKLPSEENVLSTYARIVDISPTNKHALETLAKGYKSRERWPDLLKVLQKKVLVTDDPEELLELFHQIAEIAITRMSNETQAIPFLERILELDPHNLEVVERLKDIYQRKHNQEKLYAILLRELSFLTGPQREATLAQAAVMARDRLLRFEDALKHFEELYRLNPNHREARENLHQLYMRLERWTDYATFLKEEVQRPMPVKRRIELLHKLGEVLQERLGNVTEAKGVFETIVTLDPNDDLAAHRLEQIYLEHEDLKALHALFAKRGDLRSYVAFLAQQEGKEEDTHRRVALNLAMAETCERDLNEPSRALRFYEKAFALDKSLVDVGRKLLVAFEASGDVEKAAAVLQELTPVIADVPERRDAYLKLHDLLSRLGRHRDALAAACEAVRLSMLDGDPKAVLDIARKTAHEASLFEEFAQILEEVAAATMDSEWRIALLVELGSIYKDRLFYPEQARESLERALDLNPSNHNALDMLEDIALQVEDYVGLERVFKRRLEVAKDENEGRDIRMRLGRLYEDLLGDDIAASECYMQVLQVSGDDREALAGLHRTYERSEKYIELSDVIRMEINLATNERDKARFQCDLARVCWEHLEDYEEALSLLGAVVRNDPNNEDAIAQLKALFEKRLAREAAANILAPLYRETGRADELLSLLEARLDDLVRPEARAAVLMELADIREKVKKDVQSAFENAAQAVALHPTEAYVERMLHLADITGGHEKAAAVIGSWVGITPPGAEIIQTTLLDATREARLSLILGHLYADRLGMYDLAIRSFEKALPFEEQDEPLLRSLINLYRKIGDVNAILRTYDRLADSLTDLAKRRQVLYEKAALARSERMLEESADTLRSLLDQSDKDVEVALELEDVLLSLRRLEDVLGVMERRLRWAETPTERAEILYQMAAICRDQLKKYNLAAEYLVRALAEEPSRIEFRAAAKQLCLDSSLEGYSQFVGPLMTSLEAVLRQDPGAKEDLIGVLKARARLATTPWERVTVLTEIAGLENGLGRFDSAFSTLREALASMPDDQSLLERFIEAGETAGRIEELVTALEEIASTAGVDGRTRILLRVADLCRVRLSDNLRAMTIYDQLLELQPGSLTVMQEMDSLLHEMGREAERIPLLQEMALIAPTMEAKRTIYLAIGDICHATGDLDGAIRSYEYVIERRIAEDSLDQMALEAVRRLLAIADITGRVRKVVELHLLVGRTAGDPMVARRELMSAAGKLDGVLKEPGQALAIYEELLTRDPSDCEVRELAKDCARRIGDVDKQLELLAAGVDKARDEASKLKYLIEMAELQVEKDGPSLDALTTIKRVLEADPSNNVVLSLLRRFLQVEALVDEASLLLEDAAKRSQRDEDLILALAVRAERQPDPYERAITRSRLAETLEKVGRIEEAISVYEAAYRDKPVDADISKELARLLISRARPEGLCQITMEVTQGLLNVPERMEVRLRAARALIEAGQHGPALTLLEANISDEPSHRESLELLVNVSRESGRYDAMVRALEVMAENETEPTKQIALYRQATSAARDGLHDDELVLRYLRKILEIEPLDADALKETTAILEVRKDTAGLAELRRHELRHLCGRDDPVSCKRAATLRRLLATHSLDVGDFESAVMYARELVTAKLPSIEDLATARWVWSETDFSAELFNEMTEAFERVGDFESLLDLTRFAASLDLSHLPRLDMLVRAVELAEKLGRDDTAFEDLVALVELSPETAGCISKLEAVGRRLGRLEGVKDALVSAFSRHQDKPIAYDLAVMIARILRDDLGKLDEAADYLRVAFLRNPGEAQISNELADLYENIKRYGDLAILYETLGDMEQDGMMRVTLYFKAFETIRHKIQDPIGATEMLKKILEQDPNNHPALDATEAIAREIGDFTLLAQVLARKAEIAMSQIERRRLILELATVQAERLNDVGSAITTVRELLEADPSFEEGYAKLEGLLAGSGRFAELASLYEREADISQDVEAKVAALKKAAAVYEARLSDRITAIALLQKVLDVEPSNQFAFVRLESLFQETGDSSSLYDLLKRRLVTVHSTAEQVELHLKIGKVLSDSIGDKTGALDHFKAALNLDPYCEEALRGLEALVDQPEVAMDAILALENLYEATGQYLKLCTVLRLQLDLVETAAEREHLLIKIAEIQKEHLNDPIGAQKTFGEALQLNPSNAETLKQLEAVAAITNRWEDVYRLLDKVACEALTPETKARVHHEAAKIAEERLHSIAEAVVHYEAFLEINPGDLETLEKLEKLYTEMKKWEQVARVLTQRIGLCGGGAAPDLRIKLATVLANELADPIGAVEQLREALAAQPGNREAIRVLGRLSNHPVAGRHALELMTSAFREMGDDGGLMWALERLIGQTKDGPEVFMLHDEAASVARRLGKASSALEHLGMALLASPSDEGVLTRLLETAREYGMQAEAIRFIVLAADAAQWEELEKSLRIQAARLGLETGAMTPEIAHCLERVLEIDPVNREALEVLERHYENQPDDLVKILEKKLRLDLSTDERAATLRKIGEIRESKGEFEEAASAYEEMVTHEPSSLDLLRRLERVYRRSGNMSGLVSTLERLAGVIGDITEATQLLLEAAQIQNEVLNDPDSARITVENLLSIEPDNARARSMLLAINERLGDWRSVLKILAEDIESAPDAKSRLAAAIRAAGVAETKVEDLAAALSYLNQAYAIDPKSMEVLDEKIRLHHRVGDHLGLIETLRRKAALVDRTERLRLLDKACDVALTELEDFEIASTIAQEILAIEPTSPSALLVMARKMESKGQNEEALVLYRRLANTSNEDDRHVEALVGIARIVGQGEEALEALREAVRIRPDHQEANRLLRKLLLRSGDKLGVIEVLKRELRDAKDDAERARICMDIAELYLNDLKDEAMFLQWAEEAYRARRDDPRVVAGIVDYYLRLGQAQRAVPYLEWLVSYLEAKRRLQELSRYACELGKISEKLGDLEKAITYYRLCHDHDSSNIENALSLGRLYMKRKEYEKALRVYQPLILKMDILAKGARVEVLLALARIHLARADNKKARQYVLRVLSEEPENVEAQELLRNGL